MDISPTPSEQIASSPPNISLPPKPTHKLIFIIGGVIILFTGLFGGYYLVKSANPPKKACTMEAKLCPDGSSVGRTGPNCEFAPCPQITTAQPSPTPNPTANWKTYTDIKSGFSLKYPSDYFIFQGDPSLGFFLATSAPRGGNGPKFLGENDVWLSVSGSNSSVQTLDQYIASQQSLYNNIQKKSVTLGGIASYKITYTLQAFPAGSSSTTIYSSDGLVMRDGKISTISLSAFRQNLLDSQQVMFDKILSTFKFLDQKSDNSASQECGVCGPEGIHNVNGAVCAPGLICKRGLTTSLSYCVGQDVSPANCEKNQ